jgi:dTDP-6-deoxy-L-talose 4-dehydrogenase (NAD+)
MKILVTGASGFIGRHLINELIEQTSHEIIATSRDLSKARSCDWFGKVRYIPYDLDSSIEDLFDYFGRPDKVIHLAWDGLPNYNDSLHIEKNLYRHYFFIKNLIANGLKEITVTGTCFEYGMKNGCLSENDQTEPSNMYGLAKDTLRKILVELSKSYDFKYKWIRLFYMYGEGQSSSSLFSLLDSAILNKSDSFDMSGGEQLRDFLHIDDVVRNIYLISQQTLYLNQSINCCSGVGASVRRLVEEYLKERNHNLKLNLGVYPYPKHEPMAFWGDIRKLESIKKHAI